MSRISGSQVRERPRRVPQPVPRAPPAGSDPRVLLAPPFQCPSAGAAASPTYSPRRRRHDDLTKPTDISPSHLPDASSLVKQYAFYMKRALVSDPIQPLPPQPPSEPVSEPQTTARLPPRQAIPEGAVPEGPTPLAGEAGLLPLRPPADPKDEQSAEVSDAGSSAAAPVPSPPSRPVPRLGQVLTTLQRRELNETIDRSLDAAQSSVAAVVQQTLSADQVNSVRRIRAIIGQARETRQQDLALAKNLADRARLLAQDLEHGLR